MIGQLELHCKESVAALLDHNCLLHIPCHATDFNMKCFVNLESPAWRAPAAHQTPTLTWPVK